MGWAWGFTVDDAFIVARYAERIARGHGYTYNDGPATDGVTGPLLLAFEVVAAALHVSPIASAKVVGAVSAITAALVTLTALRTRPGTRVAALVAVGAVMLSFDFVAWSVAGLETGLAMLGIALLSSAALSPCARPFWGAMGFGVIGAVAIPWLRPELVPCAGILALAADTRGRGSRWIHCSSIAASGFALCIWRSWMFGGVLPLSFYAKPAEVTHGIEYVLLGLAIQGGVANAIHVFAWKRMRGHERWLIVAYFVAVVSVALAGGDWMPGFRLLAPSLPVLAMIFAVAMTRVRSRGWIVRLFVVVAFLWGPTLSFLSMSKWSGFRDGVTSAERFALAQRSALFATQAGGSIAAVDIGRLGMMRPGPIFDLGGVTDPRVARARGEHLAKRIPDDVIREMNPEILVLGTSPRSVAAILERVAVQDKNSVDSALIILCAEARFPVERRLACHPFVRARYVFEGAIPYSDALAYVVLRR